MTLRFTSPQVAMESISSASSAAIVAFMSPLAMPWNWNVWRVVSRSEPFA